MIQKIFQWFYCLPMWEAAMLVAMCAAGYLILMHMCCTNRVWRIGNVILLVVWAAMVIYMTLLSREADPVLESKFIPFHSYYAVWNGANREILRSNLMNVLLFVPGGLLGAGLLPDTWKWWYRLSGVLLVFTAMSMGIEFFQFYFLLGKTEIDDVIHNSFGALLGTIAVLTSQKYMEKNRRG